MRVKHKKGVVIACLTTLLLAMAIWTIWGNTALMVEEVSLSSDKLPAAFSGFRIAHISDLHNAEFGEGNGGLLQLISNAGPDIIVITGDLIDSSHTDMEIAVTFAENAVNIAPTYYVSGNHEAHISGYDNFKERLVSVGVTVLEDQTVPLERGGESITLVGLSDPDFTIRGDMFGEVPAMISTKLNNLLDGVDGFTLVLSHRPELFDIYVSCGVDLVLSGHAHGGQFRLPFVGGLIAPSQGLFPKYDAGQFSRGDTSMIVSRGLGNSVIPVRFNNRPAITMVELNFAPSIGG